MNHFRLLPSQIKYIQSLKAKKDNASIIRELEKSNMDLIRVLNQKEETIWELRNALHKIDDAVYGARGLF